MVMPAPIEPRVLATSRRRTRGSRRRSVTGAGVVDGGGDDLALMDFAKGRNLWRAAAAIRRRGKVGERGWEEKGGSAREEGSGDESGGGTVRTKICAGQRGARAFDEGGAHGNPDSCCGAPPS
jgi:hypothetical protein